MKAERRHELQQSDLAKVIKQAPGFWQQSGGKYLLVAIAAIVVFILVRYRITSSRAEAAQALESLAQGRGLIDQIQRLPRRWAFLPAGQAAVERRQIFNDATTFITDASTRSDDRQIAAEALIAKGDLNWAASLLPDLPGASTQPSLQFKDPKELTAAAADAYQQVMNSYSDVKHAAIAARFGLAAIAENRGDFDAAKGHYEAVVKQATDVISYQKLATDRLRMLAELNKPVILAKPTTEPAEPVTPTTQSMPPLIAAPMPATTQSSATQAVAAESAKPQAATAPTSQP